MAPGTMADTPTSPFRLRIAPSSTAFTSSSSRILRAYSTQPPRGPNSTVKFWPFLAIIGVGTGAYVLLAKSRAENRHAPVRRLQ